MGSHASKGQHDSLDEPPRIPLFTGTCGTKGSRRDSLTDALTSAATAVVGILSHKDHAESSSDASGKVSPAKRARVSGQYLGHLEKLKNIHESGVLSCEEFEEQKAFALKNIRQLNC